MTISHNLGLSVVPACHRIIAYSRPAWYLPYLTNFNRPFRHILPREGARWTRIASIDTTLVQQIYPHLRSKIIDSNISLLIMKSTLKLRISKQTDPQRSPSPPLASYQPSHHSSFSPKPLSSSSSSSSNKQHITT